MNYHFNKYNCYTTYVDHRLFSMLLNEISLFFSECFFPRFVVPFISLLIERFFYGRFNAINGDQHFLNRFVPYRYRKTNCFKGEFVQNREVTSFCE